MAYTMAQPRPVGHISSDRLLSRQAETYEAKIQAMGELLESEKRLALETQVGGGRGEHTLRRWEVSMRRWVGQRIDPPPRRCSHPVTPLSLERRCPKP